LRELIIGCLRHAQKVIARLGRGIAARWPLKQLRAQPLFHRVYMPGHGGMMHAQKRPAPRPRR